MISKKIKERNKFLEQKRKNVKTLTQEDELNYYLENNIKIPHKLRDNAKNILDSIIYDKKQENIYTYPKILITTSHSPSELLKNFSKHLSLIFNAKNLMRSKFTETQLFDYCNSNRITHLLILNENKGNPSTLILSKFPYGKTYYFSLFNLKYERRQKSFKENVNLILNDFETEIGKSLHLDLRLMFNKNKKKTEENDRVLGIIKKDETLAFRHFLIEKRKLKKECSFDLKLYKVNKGTFNMEGDTEYVLNAFTNSKKNNGI